LGFWARRSFLIELFTLFCFFLSLLLCFFSSLSLLPSSFAFCFVFSFFGLERKRRRKRKSEKKKTQKVLPSISFFLSFFLFFSFLFERTNDFLNLKKINAKEKWRESRKSVLTAPRINQHRHEPHAHEAQRSRCVWRAFALRPVPLQPPLLAPSGLPSSRSFLAAAASFLRRPGAAEDRSAA